MSEAVELLGCPFCGGEALKCKGQFNNMRWVLCRACHASPGDYPTEAEAVAAWNRRSLTGEVEPVACPDREAVIACIRDAADRAFEAGRQGDIHFRFGDIIARADALLSGGGE